MESNKGKDGVEFTEGNKEGICPIMGVGKATSPILGHVAASNPIGLCQKIRSGGPRLERTRERV
jgi:hypothetical protein